MIQIITTSKSYCIIDNDATNFKERIGSIMNRKKHKNRISFVVLFTVCFTLMISIIGCSKQEKTKETTATSTPTDISKETETPTPKTTHPPKVASDNKETITPTISAVPDATTELTPTVEIAADSIESATPAAPMNDYDTRKCLRHLNSPSPSFMRGIRGFPFSSFSCIIVL